MNVNYLLESCQELKKTINDYNIIVKTENLPKNIKCLLFKYDSHNFIRINDNETIEEMRKILIHQLKKIRNPKNYKNVFSYQLNNENNN